MQAMYIVGAVGFACSAAGLVMVYRRPRIIPGPTDAMIAIPAALCTLAAALITVVALTSARPVLWAAWLVIVAGGLTLVRFLIADRVAVAALRAGRAHLASRR